MKIIRKISIGNNYPGGSLHYVVGTTVRLKDAIYTISSINEVKDGVFNIFIKNDDGTVLWKTSYNSSIVIENDVNFD